MVVEMDYLNLIVALLIPIAVAIVTRQVTHSGVKAALLAGLSGLSAGVTTVIDGGGIWSSDVVELAVVNFVVAVSAYYGFYKPTGATQAVARTTDSAGVGLTIKASSAEEEAEGSTH